MYEYVRVCEFKSEIETGSRAPPARCLYTQGEQTPVTRREIRLANGREHYSTSSLRATSPNGMTIMALSMSAADRGTIAFSLQRKQIILLRVLSYTKICKMCDETDKPLNI